jgi:ribosomal protein S30
MSLDAALTSIGVARFATPDIRAFQRHGEPITLVSRNRRDAGKRVHGI